MENIVIFERRDKVVRQVIFTTLLLLVSVYIIIGGWRNNELVYLIAGIIGVLLFGASLIFVGRGLFVRRPLLTITPEGIVDTSTITSIGIIRWDEIASVTLVKRFRQTFVDIEARDAAAVIGRLTDFRRFLLRVNMESKQTLVSIPLGTAELSEDEVRAILERKLREHGRKLMLA